MQEVDSVIADIPYGDEHTSQPVQKIRDILKNAIIRSNGETAYILLGIELQSDIHYAMPVKAMVYDALNYSIQVANTAKSHRNSKRIEKHTNAEFLSGFYKKDYLIPVITVVVYFGTEIWDAPRSLHEMLKKEKIEQNILKYVNNYKLNLIIPNEFTDSELNKFSEELGCVLGFIKYAKEKEKLKKFIGENKKFHNLTRKATEVLNYCVGAKIQTNNQKEVIDVCKALEDLRKEALEQGIEQGSLKGKIEILTGLVRDGLLTKEIDAERLKITPEEFQNYL